MDRMRLAGAVTATGLLLAGCGKGTAAPPAPYRATLTAGGRTVSVRLDPAPAANRRSILTVRFSGPGAAVRQAQARLTMQGMVMPPLTVALHPAGNGRFQGQAIFTMAGTWTLGLRWEGGRGGAAAACAVPVRP